MPVKILFWWLILDLCWFLNKSLGFVSCSEVIELVELTWTQLTSRKTLLFLLLCAVDIRSREREREKEREAAGFSLIDCSVLIS